jgi:Protein of unknown function (DUF3489)
MEVMDVVTAVINRRGESTMTTPNTEEQTTPAASGAAQEPKATTKANVAPRKPRVAASKGKSGKKTTPTKKGAKVGKTAKKASGAREGSKTAKVLDLLKRPGGATLKDVMKATSWQAHSVRGLISGTLGKKMGLKVESTKTEDGERVYSLAK